MSTDNLIGLIVFLWLLAIYGILIFMRAANPYRKDSEEQKAEDREQEEILRAWSAKHRSKKKR